MNRKSVRWFNFTELGRWVEPIVISTGCALVETGSCRFTTFIAADGLVGSEWTRITYRANSARAGRSIS